MDLRNNQLTSIPESISQLTNLTGLDLRNNQLTSIP
ncbi:leucine-rich repeat domain-containing protein, partial [Okeania hirsuta]